MNALLHALQVLLFARLCSQLSWVSLVRHGALPANLESLCHKHASGLDAAGDEVRPALAVCDATIPTSLLLAPSPRGDDSSAAPSLALEVLRGGAVTVQQHTSAGYANRARLRNATHRLPLPTCSTTVASRRSLSSDRAVRILRSWHVCTRHEKFELRLQQWCAQAWHCSSGSNPPLCSATRGPGCAGEQPAD